MASDRNPGGRHSPTVPTEDQIAQGRIRRAAPLASMAARTTGEAVVAALRHKAFGTDSTEFHERNAERYTQAARSFQGRAHEDRSDAVLRDVG